MNKRWVSIWFQSLSGNLGELCQKAKKYTPVTALDEPDGLLLDVTGCAHLFGGEARLLSMIQADYEVLGHLNQVAMAPNPAAAWALSHFKPGSLVSDQNLVGTLGTLPIKSLRLPEKSERMLDDLSIRFISELLILPRQQVLKRFGRETLLCLDRALGAELSLVQSVPETKFWRLHEEFIEPVRYAQMLEQALSELLKKLCQMLCEDFLGMTEIQITLVRLDRTKIVRKIGVALPSHDPVYLEKLSKLKLERLDLGLGIEAMSLDATRVSPMPTAPVPERDWLAWRDLISNRLGSKSLFYLNPRESHIPERAVVKAEICRVGEFTIGARPILFLHPPETIGAIALLPDSAPAQIRWRGRVIKITQAEGPERIEPEWWLSGETGVARDYYRVESAEGLRLWVFKQGSPPCWYAQGIFA